MSKDIVVGIIGGSGLYEMEGLKDAEEVRLETPFGEPSDAFLVGRLEGAKVVFCTRHGRGHRVSPSNINYRANIWGLKKLGARCIISVSACGSLRHSIPPGNIVVIDQFIDRTFKRANTFFDKGVVVHVSFAQPICSSLANILYGAGKKVGANMTKGGTYICIEGPQFSTKAESAVWRDWKADVIGMTNVTEAKLAREAELCYATIALSTDYDCWLEREEAVTGEMVMETMAKNIASAKKIVREAVKMIPRKKACACCEVLKFSIITNPKFIPEDAKKRYELLIGKYIS